MLECPILDSIPSKKEALRLKEVLAQRLRQTNGVRSIQDARACLELVVRGMPEGNRFWYAIDLAPNRPVEKLDLFKVAMREFLLGFMKGERTGERAAQKVDTDPLKSRGGLGKMLKVKRKA